MKKGSDTDSNQKYNGERREYNRKYMKDYREGNREEYNKYMREWMRDKREGFPTTKELVERYFPREELNQRLDQILKNNSACIEQKKIKDLVHLILNEKRFSSLKEEVSKELDNIFNKNPDELDKKISKNILLKVFKRDKLLGIRHLEKIDTDLYWSNAIEEFMLQKEYVKEGNKYVPKRK